MARVLYGVAGEGMGHAVRAVPIVEYLLAQGHDVRVFAGGRAFRYLSSHFSGVLEISYLPIMYRDGRVHDSLTAVVNFFRFGSYVRSFRKVWIFLGAWRPDVVISDFEPFTAWCAWMKGVPLLSLGNHHVLTRSFFRSDLGDLLDSFKTRVITFFMTPGASEYVVCWFERDLQVRSRTVVVDPPLRQGVLNASVSEGGRILVYQTSSSNKALIDVLLSVDANFVVYGYDRCDVLGNIVFRKFDERQFFRDLFSCRAVVTNGGFSLISEALFLGKPLLMCPVGKQYEQLHNALAVERLGYGVCVRDMDVSAVGSFLKCLGGYRRALDGYRRDGNKSCFERVDGFISRFS